MHHGLHLAATGAIVVLAAAGCAGGGARGEDVAVPVGTPADPAATASAWDSTMVAPAPLMLRLGDGSSPAATVVDLSSVREAREGTDYDVLSTAASTSTAWRVTPLALGADGRVFATRVASSGVDDGAWLAHPAEVGMLDGSSFTAWPSSQTALEDEHPRQVFAASIDGSIAAWAETESTQAGTASWRIFAGDGGDPRLVARSEDVSAGSAEPATSDGEARPLLRDGRVYWTTAVSLAARDAAASGVQVMSRSADARDEAVVEAAGASQPAVGTGGLYVARTSRDDPATVDGTFSIDHSDGHGGTSPVVSYVGDVGTSVRSLVASGDRLAFVVAPDGGTGGQVVVLDVPTGAVTTVPLLTSGREVSIALCGDRLVWTSANGSTGVRDNASIGVLDVATGDLARVVEPDNFAGVQCVGDLVEWQTIRLPDGTGTPVVVRWSDR